jgi:hypothetical protein
MSARTFSAASSTPSALRSPATATCSKPSSRSASASGLGDDGMVIHDQDPGKRVLHLTRSPL